MGLIRVGPKIEDVPGMCYIANTHWIARYVLNGKCPIGRIQESMVKSGRTAKGRGKPSCHVIAGQIPCIANDKIVVLSFGLKGFEPESNVMKSLIPGDLLPLAFTSSPDSSQGERDTVRVVEMVESCNSSGTEPSPAIGIEGVSGNLDNLSIFQIS